MSEGEVMEQIVGYMSLLLLGVSIIFTVVSTYIVALNYFVGDANLLARVGAFAFVSLILALLLVVMVGAQTAHDGLIERLRELDAERLEWLQPYGASALFAAGGTGEFFSLEPGEYSEVIQGRAGHLPQPHPHPGRRRWPDARGHPVRPRSRAPGRPRHPAAAALPDRSQPRRPDRPRSSRVPQRASSGWWSTTGAAAA